MAIRVRFGEFELDEARFELRQAGEAVEVQPKVLDLIFYLAKNADRVVTKTELLDQVWPGVVVTEASLSQAVSAARRALGDDGAAQTLIRTVRGRGFRFTAELETTRGPSGSSPPPKGQSSVPSAASTPSGAPARPAPEKLSSQFESPPSSLGTFESARAALSTTNPSLELETHEESARSARRGTRQAHLFILCQADEPARGGARYALEGIDDVEIIRGAERGVSRNLDGPTKRLVITVPGALVSRRHAQLVRGLGDWQLVDLESKNGTYVGGERIKRHVLADGDLFECGHTVFLFRAAMETPAGLKPDADTRGMKQRALASLVPERQAVRHALTRIARSELSILLEGESGSGKELAAQAFHALSERTGPLVPVSCGALGEHPEAALFGSVRQSVTATGEAEPGFLQQAHTGTLLLDQVESLPLAAQAALVRALDAQEVVAVGAAQRTQIDVRVIAATTAELAAEVSSGRFRADLYARLSGFRFQLPALRERVEDFGLILGDLLAELELPLKLEPAALRAMVAYPWPGNIRELRQTLIAAAALAPLSEVGLEHLPLHLAPGTREQG